MASDNPKTIPTREHRRAAANALLRFAYVYPDRQAALDAWIESGEPHGSWTYRELDAVAQAIADEGEAGIRTCVTRLSLCVYSYSSIANCLPPTTDAASASICASTVRATLRARFGSACCSTRSDVTS